MSDDKTHRWPLLRLRRAVVGPLRPPAGLIGADGLSQDRSGSVDRDHPPLPPARRAALRTRSVRELPQSWTVVHVLDRMEEAFEVLARLPMNTRPRGYANSMPTYAYDRSDLIAQVETGELERLMKLQNKIRLSATAGEVARMEESLHWPLQYLRDDPDVARAVQLSSLWAAMRVDPKKRLKALGLDRRNFYRRKMAGLEAIAVALVQRRVLVR